jgi:hypothetical protein
MTGTAVALFIVAFAMSWHGALAVLHDDDPAGVVWCIGSCVVGSVALALVLSAASR